MEHHLAVAEASLRASQAAPPLRPLRYSSIGSAAYGSAPSSPTGSFPYGGTTNITSGMAQPPLVDKMMDFVHSKAEASDNPAAVYTQVRMHTASPITLVCMWGCSVKRPGISIVFLNIVIETALLCPSSGS